MYQGQAQRLRKANAEITSELEMNRLGKGQVQIVKANDHNLDQVRGSQVNWREITFEGTLGSGTFGDCYKGSLYERPVAVKKMRSSLVDENGFRSFCRE